MIYVLLFLNAISISEQRGRPRSPAARVSHMLLGILSGGWTKAEVVGQDRAHQRGGQGQGSGRYD